MPSLRQNRSWTPVSANRHWGQDTSVCPSYDSWHEDRKHSLGSLEPWSHLSQPPLKKDGMWKVHLGKENRNERVSGKHAFSRRLENESPFLERARQRENKQGKSGFFKSKKDEPKYQCTHHLSFLCNQIWKPYLSLQKHFLKLGWEMDSKTLKSGISAYKKGRHVIVTCENAKQRG